MKGGKSDRIHQSTKKEKGCVYYKEGRQERAGGFKEGERSGGKSTKRRGEYEWRWRRGYIEELDGSLDVDRSIDRRSRSASDAKVVFLESEETETM